MKTSAVPPTPVATMTRRGLPVSWAEPKDGNMIARMVTARRCFMARLRSHRLLVRYRQLEQARRIAPENRVPLALWQIEILDQFDGSRLERRERGSIAAVEHMVRADGVEHEARGRSVISHAVEVHHPQVVARRVLDFHRRIGAEEERLVLQFIGVVEPSDHLADAAAAV